LRGVDRFDRGQPAGAKERLGHRDHRVPRPGDQQHPAVADHPLHDQVGHRVLGGGVLLPDLGQVVAHPRAEAGLRGVGSLVHPVSLLRFRPPRHSHPCSVSLSRSERARPSRSRKSSTVSTTGARPSSSPVCMPWATITSAVIPRAVVMSVFSTLAVTPRSLSAPSAVIFSIRLDPMPTPQTASTTRGSERVIRASSPFLRGVSRSVLPGTRRGAHPGASRGCAGPPAPPTLRPPPAPSSPPCPPRPPRCAACAGPAPRARPAG